MTTEPLIITNVTVCDVRAGTLVLDQSVVAVDGLARSTAPPGRRMAHGCSMPGARSSHRG